MKYLTSIANYLLLLRIAGNSILKPVQSKVWLGSVLSESDCVNNVWDSIPPLQEH